MKKKLHVFFCVFFTCLFISTLNAQNHNGTNTGPRQINKKLSATIQKDAISSTALNLTDNGVDIYGCRIANEDEDVPAWIKLNSSVPSSATEIKRYFPGYFVWAGAYVDKNLDGNGLTYAYRVLYEEDYQMYLPYDFIEIDIQTGNFTVIRDEVEEMEMIKLTDMSYDYTTNTMYGIISNSGPDYSKIVTINLNTGYYSDVVEIENEYIRCMAIDFEGQMWGVTGLGDLVKIDKNTGNCTFIGETRVFPNYNQSMEFDHSTGNLYWAFCDDYRGSLMKIDTTTGEALNLGTIRDNAEVTSLSIPFSITRGPKAITDLTIEPGTNGTLSAILRWTNPIENIDGTPANITKVEVYRNETLIHTVQSPGTTSSWTDNITEAGTITYKLIPYSNKGAGESAKKSAYIGTDLPGKVTNIMLKAEEMSAVLTWEAPQEGMNGGWFDHSSLTYTIVRLPDNTELATEWTTTTYTDNTITELNVYSYKIIPKTNIGVGAESVSNPLLIGEAISVPYQMGFGENENYQIWTILDVNQDEVTWNHYDAAFLEFRDCMRYTFHRTNTADDWLFTPKFKLEKEKAYSIKFKVRQGFATDTEKLALYLLPETDPNNMEKEKIWFKEKFDNKAYEDFEVIIPGPETGEYTLGFHVYSDPNQMALYVDEFSIQQYAVTDAALSKLLAPQRAMKDTQFNLQAIVYNPGENLVTNYVVKILDNNDNILATVDNGPDIESKQSETIDISFTPSTEGTLTIRAKVEMEGDLIPSNNYSAEHIMFIEAEGNVFTGTIGEEPGVLNSYVPFSFNDHISVAQSIYYKHEIGLPGTITQISYPYQFEEEGKAKPVKVWMANTTMDKIDNWIPEPEFILVYDGNIDIPKGNHSLVLELDRPFAYNGQNLVLMTERIKDNNTLSNRSYFYRTSTPDFQNRTRYYRSDDLPFNWQQPGMGVSYYPNIGFKIALSGGSVSGIISDVNGPLKDVEISIEGSTVKRITNNQGEYKFEFLPTGNYALKANKVGYLEKTKDNVIVTAENNTIADLVIETIPTYKVSGKITSGDEPIKDAVVKLNGYSNYQTTTNSEGKYEIQEVYTGYTYVVEVSKERFIRQTSTIEVKGNDISNLDFELEVIITPVWKVEAKEAGNNVKISWKDFQNTVPAYYILDDESSEGGVSFQPPGYGSLGNLFENNKTGSIFSVDVYGRRNENAGDRKVQIDIFDSNRELIGSSEPFLLPADEWINVELPNIPYNGSFYAMVTWPETPNVTHSLAYDNDGTNAFLDYDYICRDGVWALFHEATPSVDNAVFLIRVNVFEDGQSSIYGIRKNKSGNELSVDMDNFYFSKYIRNAGAPVSGNQLKSIQEISKYNIYRGLASNTENIDNWEMLNTEPLSQQSFTDETWKSLEKGIYQYAVKSVYSGGKISEAVLSNEIEKTDGGSIGNQNLSEWKVYPNPFMDKILISNSDQIKTASIINPVTGQTLKEILMNGKSVIHLSDLNSGVYLVVLNGFNGEKITVKMIKQ